MPSPSYVVVSYTPAIDAMYTGIAVITVNDGVRDCCLNSDIDIDYGVIQNDSAWDAAIDPVVAQVALNMQEEIPNPAFDDRTMISNPSFDPSLVACYLP